MLDQVVTLDYEGKEITLVGTAHVSKDSVALVKQTIDTVLPDTVCIELDDDRYRNLQNPQRWENTSVFTIIKEKKVGLLLANTILSSYQKRVAEKMNTAPGQEMLQGIQSAEEHKCKIVLADRNIQTTFLRIWRKLSFLEKCRLFGSFLFEHEEDVDIDFNELIADDNLAAALSSMKQGFSGVSEVLIHERDQHLAYKIKNAPGKRIVAIVGAAHIPGIQKEIYQQQDIGKITTVPKGSYITKIIAWGIPIAILFLIAYGFATNLQTGLHQLKSWVLWNSILAAGFTAIVLGHPASILTAFVSAPVTSLNPLLACGWLAGLVEATVRKPTVRDINNVPEDIFHIKGLVKNWFLRALLVVIFANIGSSIGTLIAGTDIVRSLL